MNVCVDIGNTRAKLGFFEEHRLLKREVIALDKIADRVNELRPKAVILASVSHELRSIWEQIDRTIPCLILSTQTALPIQLDYKTPLTLGVDRIAAVMGAYSLNPQQASLAIDLGTCITYDLIDPKGTYLGGGIAPGYQMRLKSLNYFTEKLPLVVAKLDSPLLGKSTEESILSGVCQGIQLEIEGFIREYRKKFRDLKVFLCGGDSHRVKVERQQGIYEEPDLVLMGLNAILRYNVEKSINFFDR